VKKGDPKLSWTAVFGINSLTWSGPLCVHNRGHTC